MLVEIMVAPEDDAAMGKSIAHVKSSSPSRATFPTRSP